MRTASRGQVYFGGALWQMLHNAVNGVDESAMSSLCFEGVIVEEGKCQRGTWIDM